ncbi:MAG: peptidylprolyl isomerase [Saprospiraceae bacterium]|nr:peptidylprolyl isomerase [Candidatus Brachybacter algidus]
MGIITSIRKRGGLMIVLIGLAVAGFIVMDVVQNRNMSGNVTNVGKVGSHTLDFNDMRSMEEILYQGSDADEYSKREYIWNYFVDNSILQTAAQKLGLAVGKAELIDMQFGANISPLMAQRYGNPQTGQVDMAQLQNVRDQIKKGTLPANMASFWAIQEKEIIKDRLDQKMTSLFTKAIYTPTWQAEAVINDQGAPINALYVKVPTSFINDADVKLTDADYQKYIDAHKGAYTNKTETRVISFASILVVVSKQDTLDSEQIIKDKMVDFKTAVNDSAFVLANGGTISDVFVKSDQLDQGIKSKVSGMNTGDVYGPYVESNVVKAVKLLGKSSVADSVKSRHILISAKSPAEFEVANKRIDSAMAVINADKSKFAAVAKAISTDGGSAVKGGDLGYAPQGKFVKPFNDAIFFDIKVGDMKKVTSDFGVHLIQVMDKKTLGDANGYKVAYISTELVPSEESQNRVAAQVQTLVAGIKTIDQLEAKIKATPGLQMQNSFAVDESDFALQNVPPGQGSRDIIKWAFDSKTKVGDVAQEPFPIQQTGKYYVEQIVVPALKVINNKGVSEVASIKADITPMVMAEKKVEMLAEKAKNTKSLEALAQEFNVKVDTAKSVVFGANYAPVFGKEPKVVAAIYALPINSISPLIKGYNGIFLVKPYEKTAGATRPPIENAKRFYSTSIKQQMNGKILDALKKKTDITDNRGKLF